MRRQSKLNQIRMMAIYAITLRMDAGLIKRAEICDVLCLYPALFNNNDQAYASLKLATDIGLLPRVGKLTYLLNIGFDFDKLPTPLSMPEKQQRAIVDYIYDNPDCSSKEIRIALKDHSAFDFDKESELVKTICIRVKFLSLKKVIKATTEMGSNHYRYTVINYNAIRRTAELPVMPRLIKVKKKGIEFLSTSEIITSMFLPVSNAGSGCCV